MTTFTKEYSERLIMTRYYSNRIGEDRSIDTLYQMLYSLTQEELCNLNEDNSELTTKRMLAAKYIEKSIEKFYNFVREIQHARRKVTEERMTQILYEKTYWRDIAHGVPEK
jgi:DNA gyrase/topoisomerase IV subunit A